MYPLNLINWGIMAGWKPIIPCFGHSEIIYPILIRTLILKTFFVTSCICCVYIVFRSKNVVMHLLWPTVFGGRICCRQTVRPYYTSYVPSAFFFKFCSSLLYKLCVFLKLFNCFAEIAPLYLNWGWLFMWFATSWPGIYFRYVFTWICRCIHIQIKLKVHFAPMLLARQWTLYLAPPVVEA